MLRREIEKEGWLEFYDRKHLDEEISPRELGRNVYSAYKHCAMTGRGVQNKKLKERFENLKYELCSIKDITNISYLKKAKLYNRSMSDEYNDFLVVEVNNRPEIILDITTGEDVSMYDVPNLSIYPGITIIKSLYKFNEKDVQMDMDMCNIKNVILYKNIELYNSFNNRAIISSDIVEYEDFKGNKFYIDILNNNIYKRDNNYYLKETENIKKYYIFDYNKKIDFDAKLFKNLKHNILKYFIEYDDEL